MSQTLEVTRSILKRCFRSRLFLTVRKLVGLLVLRHLLNKKNNLTIPTDEKFAHMFIDLKSGVPLAPQDSLLFAFMHCFKLEQFLTYFIVNF